MRNVSHSTVDDWSTEIDAIACPSDSVVNQNVYSPLSSCTLCLWERLVPPPSSGAR
ncbi:hypothetical protein [Chamaesiphon sp.]|uniref:hypothetical protein n=1 Tax=Chamaesiphon sp. TaxID=2814140 RepID=UPI0035937700